MPKARFVQLVVAAAFAAAGVVHAQAPQLHVPQPSQQASVSQTVGITEMKIDYHRPVVRGRTVWGDLVPYDQVWRAGANENTTISFSTPVTVGGRELPAGVYGLHTLPTAGDWTVILSKNSSNWGSFRYEEKDDAVRLTAKPEPGPMTEALTYTFENPTADGVRVVLAWEKLRVPFQIDVATKDLVVASLERELYGLGQFFWQPWNQAATYALQNDTHLDKAMEWVERSIQVNENFTNSRTKARLLAKRGDTAAADALMKKALPTATEAEWNAYGYQLLGENKLAEAVKIFRDNAARHPTSWNVHDSLGEGLDLSGKKVEALAAYRKALSLAPEAQKARIQGIIDRLSK